MHGIDQGASTILKDDGTEAAGRHVLVFLTDAEIEQHLAPYDPDSGTSPLVASARPLARAILDGLKKAQAP